MDIIQWYAVALAVIAALSIVFYVLGISIGFLRTYATYHFLKLVVYPRVHKLLLVCGRPNVFSERLHVSQQFKNFIHRWLSVIAMVECAVHLTAALSPTRSGTRPFTSASSIAGVTVSHNQVWSKFPC